MRKDFEKVLLINPPYSKSYFSIPVLPAGLGYLAESLKNNGIDYRVMDMSLGYKFRDLRNMIKGYTPDLLAISCISYMLDDTYKMVTELDRDFPSLKFVMGGPHVSSIKEKVLEECKALDFAVVGEGEISLVELCKGHSPDSIKGLIFRSGGEISLAGTRDFIGDLDAIRFPKYEGFELSRYGYKMIGLVTSRGCPYNCIYCSCNVIGKKIRFRSPRSIISEIEYWHKQGYREFGIQEDNPTFDRNRMLQLCEIIQKRGLKDLKLMCGNGVRADRVDRELLTEMKKAGFKRLAFGIESGSDKVLKAIKKGADAETMERAIKLATDLGFFVSLFFLVGAPEETKADVEKSIDLALRYPVQCVDFFNLVPLPGSELYSWVEANNYFVRCPKEYLNCKYHPARSTNPIFATPEFPKEERRKVLQRTWRISRKVKRAAIAKKFSKLGLLGNILATLYCTDIINRIENKALSNEFFRNTVGNLRMRVRNIFYS